MKQLVVGIIVGSLMAAAIGCSKQGAQRPATVPAKATVTYQGQPVAGATVMLVPEGTAGRSAQGVTDSSGTATLMTFEAGDGAVPGPYTVMVTKVEAGSGTGTPSPVGGKVDPQAYAKIMAEAAAKKSIPAAPKQLLPAKYSKKETSDLKVEVKSGQENHFKLDLKD